MKKVIYLSLLTMLFFSCNKEGNIKNEASSISLNEKISENGHNPDETDLQLGTSARKTSDGYVYTESNDAGKNHIIIYKKNANGRLTHQSNVASGGAGTGNLFGSQGAVILDDKHDWLYAVNAGSNSVSSFKVAADGSLTLAHTVASGGIRPVSVTVNKDILYVVNQVSANINGYKIGSNGSLTTIPSTNLTLSAPTADPGQISFGPNGKELYITERGTDKITSFQVKGQGVAYDRRVNASAGVTPFGFDFARNYMIVANAHMDLPNLGGASSYSLSNKGSISAVNGNVLNGQTASCWTVTTDHGRIAYIANSFSDNISSYYIDTKGAAYIINAAAAVTDKRPRDMAIIDNYYLYVLNVTDHTIGEYYRGPLGTLHMIGHLTNVPVWAAGLAAY
jgi:6-phosphogluconolactonase (cycloisomerase 2 family)